MVRTPFIHQKISNTFTLAGVLRSDQGGMSRQVSSERRHISRRYGEVFRKHGLCAETEDFNSGGFRFPER